MRTRTAGEDFEHDPRYRVSLRETWLCLGYWALFTAIAMAIAWSLGAGIDGAEQDFVMGFPAWFFWSGIAFVGVASFVAPYLMVRFLFRDISLEPGDDGLAHSSPGVPGPSGDDDASTGRGDH